MSNVPLLSLILWLPTVGALLLLASLGAIVAKRLVFSCFLLVFLVSLALFYVFVIVEPTVP